jgi:spore germination protein
VTTGWAGAYDYAALAPHADLITIMAYEYHGAWGSSGPVAPYDWVDQVLAFATSQMPAEKVLLGLAFYGYDWNTTSGGARSLGYHQAARLAEQYQVPIALDPATRSATFRYRAPAGDPVPTAVPLSRLQHEISERAAPPCPVARPTATPTPTPRPTPVPGAIQDHEVWLEESASAAARLELASRYQVGGVATWRLGHEDPRVWAVLQQWRHGGP